MYNNYTNPYNFGGNPFMSQMNNVQMGTPPQLQKTDLITVNGENGANAFVMAPNSKVALFDTTAPIVFIKATDGAGYATVEAFDLTPHKSIQITDHISALEARIVKLEEALNNVEKPSIKTKHATE